MATPESKSNLPRLYLIDGYSNIFRAFYAIRNLSNAQGEPTNAAFGFVQMLKKLLKDERPELVGIALDVGKQTLRKDLYEAYKANRAPMPEDLKSQLPWIRRLIEAYRIPILEEEGYEADDMLGSLAKKAAEAGYHVILVSADKDLMQLVGPRVSMYHTGRNKLYDPAGVTEDFGVPPERVVDVLALMGDASDNVPGVPGIGEKGAKGLIQEHGSLAALLENPALATKKSHQTALTEHRDKALLSLELVTIHTDRPVPFDPEALRHDPPDVPALAQLFSELGFLSLLDELKTAEGASAAPVSAPATEAADAAFWTAATAALGRRIAVAVLGSEAPLGLAVAAVGDDGMAGPVTFGDFRRDGVRDAALATLAAWSAADAVELVGHDLKEILRLLGEPGADGRSALADAMLASYVLRPSIQGHGLDELALERHAQKLITEKEVGWGKGMTPPVGDDRLLAYAGERVAVAAGLASETFRELAATPTLEKLYREVEEPLVRVLLAMEERGVLLDREFLADMSQELGSELSRLETQIYETAGETFNLNSPTQLGEILFEKLGYPVLKKTQKTKSYSTGAEVLEELAARGFPLPELMLRYRELTKLKSTYVDALPTQVAADGRLHTRFNQAVAATGRLSSVNPNLQNIPIRTELGQRIRKAFVAPPGSVLLAADYSQVELRILAHIAQEPAMIDAFRRGEDIHRTTAAAVLGVAPELVTAEQRRAAKTINFGILYGMSAFGLAAQLGIGRGDADKFIKTYLDRYAGVKRYMDETLAAAEREGKVETLYGRVRYLPDIHSKNWNLRENARRMAINARIQGTAADLLKLAMVHLEARLRAETSPARLLLTVHDELVLEVPEAEAPAVALVVKAEMEGVASLDVPLAVDTGWGRSWYEAKG